MKNRLMTSLIVLLCLTLVGVWKAGQESSDSREASSAKSANQGATKAKSNHEQGSSIAEKSFTADSSQQTEETSKSLPRETPQSLLKERLARQMTSPQKPSSPLSSSQSVFSKALDFTDTSINNRGRVQMIESLRSRNSLSTEERQSSLDFLSRNQAPQGLSDSSWHWFVDELITTLRVDGADNSQLSQSLADVALDRNHDAMVRDYALQHLGHLREEGGDREVIDSTLRKSLSERDSTLAGTALLALNHYTEEPTLGQDALEIASDPSTDLRSRITAMQVAGKQQASEALSLAVQVAGDQSQPVPLRMSAIATIGDFQANEQVTLLKELVGSSDIRLSKSAQASLLKISQ